MPIIKVYPTHEAAMDIRHPVSGALSDEGSNWEHDAYTARMLDDRAITTDPKAGHKSSRPKIDHSKPPAHATGTGVEQNEPVKAAAPEAPAASSKSKS